MAAVVAAAERAPLDRRSSAEADVRLVGRAREGDAVIDAQLVTHAKRRCEPMEARDIVVRLDTALRCHAHRGAGVGLPASGRFAIEKAIGPVELARSVDERRRENAVHRREGKITAAEA